MSKNFHNKFIGVFFSIFFIASPVLSKTVITWWGEGSAVRDPDVIDIIENRFNAQHDDIELDIVFKEEVSETTRTALLSGTGPDIFESPGPSYIKMFQDAGFVKSLDEYDKKYGWQDKLLPWAYNSGVFDGEFYAFPKNYESMIYFYNKTLFEENGWSLPTNLTEYEALAETIQAKGMYPFAYGAQGWQPTHEHLAGNYINTVAGPDNMYKALIGEKKWTDPEFVESLKLLKKHMDAGYWSGSLENYYALGWDDFNGQFANRDSAMLMIGSWGFNPTVSGFADKTDEWDWAPLPMLTPEGGNPNYQLAIGSTISINAASENADTAAYVLDWVISNREQVLELTGRFNFGAWLLPLKYQESDFGDVDPRIKRFLMDFAKTTGEGNYGYTTWSFFAADPGVHIWKDMEVVWANDITVEEFLEDHQKLWDKARKKNNTLPIGDR
ncbi:ABC transporter substrate-binding protein [Alphaproteobacteria bacterium]|jgi:raffinose/stachyose/melibiose transport system substrate-binding protein|nr:ABC transporter substrate-binding protein [Alphaproteobacteria bacterium]